MLRAAVIAVLLGLVFSKTRYDNYKVYEVEGETEDELSLINYLDTDTVLGSGIHELDVWRYAGRGLPAHISVPPEHEAAFLDRLDELGLNFKVIVENLQDKLDAAEQQAANVPKSQRNIKNTYYDVEGNAAYLKDLASRHMDIMQIVVYGQSREGRDLYFVKLAQERYSSGDPQDSKKPVIWVEATTHAREWVTNACALNFIEWLVTNADSQSDANFLLEKFDWFIVPVHNPDGYEYSHVTDRLWRKTRTSGSCLSPTNGRGSGVDPNRNWGFQWREPSWTTDKCAATYQGATAFSEADTLLMAEQMARTPAQYRKAFLSVHSYSQMILVPYGYSTSASVPRGSEHYRIANLAADAILAGSGARFSVGKPGELLGYTAAGGAYDYALGSLNYNISLTYELHPGPNNGYDGFIWPANRIEEAFDDFLASIIAIGKELA